MIDRTLGIELHQKHFNGEQLTEQEEVQLKAWYAQEDEVVEFFLQIAVPEKQLIKQLRQQINNVLEKLTQLTQNIKLVAAENDKIRKENTQLFLLLNKKQDL